MPEPISKYHDLKYGSVSPTVHSQTDCGMSNSVDRVLDDPLWKRVCEGCDLDGNRSVAATEPGSSRGFTGTLRHAQASDCNRSICAGYTSLTEPSNLVGFRKTRAGSSKLAAVADPLCLGNARLVFSSRVHGASADGFSRCDKARTSRRWSLRDGRSVA